MKQTQWNERDYRAALDALRFSQEDKAALAERLTQAEAQPSEGRERRRTPRPLWAGLAAACLCMALVGTGAAAITAIRGLTVDTFYIERKNSEQLDVKTVSGFTLDHSGRVYIPADRLNPEARAYESRVNGFDSWEEAEAFHGLELADNPVLNAAAASQWSQNGGGYCNCSVELFGLPNAVTVVEQRASYLFAPGGVQREEMPDGTSAIICDPEAPYTCITVTASAYMEDYDPAWARESSVYFANGGEVRQESYTTPSGLETVLLSIPHADGTTVYEAYFMLHDAEFRVTTGYGSSGTEYDLEILKIVLDAYA